MVNFETGDCFTLNTLTAAINAVKYVPGQISALGLFEEAGISTLTALIEEKAGKLSLVPNTPRGAPGQVVTREKRTMRSVVATHLLQDASIMADEIQNVRAFGSENSLDGIAAVRDEHLAQAARSLDATLEWHRIGAIKGEVLDADASTVLLDVFNMFGVVQQSVGMALTTSTTAIRGKCKDILEAVEGALDGISYSGVVAMCGSTFWDKLITHPKIEETYLNTQQAAALRGNPLDSFNFGGIDWTRYRGSVGGNAYIHTDEAYAVPRGVPGLFITRYAPADYVEAVNTLGLPRYAKAWEMEGGKGIKMEVQSNPINLCTRPRACIKLTKV